jgi:hypothetical protein
MKQTLRVYALWAVVSCVCASFAPVVRSAVPPRASPPQPQIIDSYESPTATAALPGPLRPFLRIAGISQKTAPDEVVPLLARNIFLIGYEGSGASRRPTEFLILLRRYVQQARELAALAGSEGVIRVTGCGDAKQLLDVLGYRTTPDCGRKSMFVETADPRRAFLTIDSGFPLPELETTLQGGKAFAYAFPNSRLPILLSERDWVAASSEGGSEENRQLLDVLLHDPALARLYYALAHTDPETQVALQRSPGLKKLVPLAAQLDFYGSYIRVRSGIVLVPGGSAQESAWKELAGASPRSPGEFVPLLLAKDSGWLAAYFDSLSRIPPEQQTHFLEPDRLRGCYRALRGKKTSPTATATVFRPDPSLLLLMTRLQWEPNGDPHIPGNLQAWKITLKKKPNSDVAANLDVETSNWRNAEGLLETMVALSRADLGGGPTEAFITLGEIDSKRAAGHRMSGPTAELMAGKFSEFRNQYPVFAEFPALSDASIADYLTTAGALAKIPDHTLRGNAMGIFEANIALWQILARQGEIPVRDQDASWHGIINPFAHVTSSAQLFDAGRSSLAQLMRASRGEPHGSQEEIIELLAGPPQTNPQSEQIHREVADRIRAVLDDQRLVSLDTLLALGDGLSPTPQGTPADETLAPLAEQLTEFQMPRPIFTSGERSTFTAGAYNNRHTELEMRTDVAKVLASRASNVDLEKARGQLAPFLRDTLVGFTYAYYEPPGAQALHNNPLLVRSHDFSAETVIGLENAVWRTPRVFGAGSPAGGGAHLVGSLADLPYVLSQMEQDFIAPENVQALIWSDLVPCILTDSVLPRWWNVSPHELHAVALYQRAGEEVLAAAMENEQLRGQAMVILSDRLGPQRSARLEEALRKHQPADVASQITPADTFYLTAVFRQKNPAQPDTWGIAGRELEDLSRQDPAALTWARLSRDFGVPHPVLAHTYGTELLNTSPFPMFERYSSQLLAETWDSTNLYWARLADEMGYPPAALNRLAPDLTVRMVAKIFASDLNDWPAILRAMRETGEEFRQGKVASLPSSSAAPQP